MQCPITETVQAARQNLRKGLTDIQTQLTLIENMQCLKTDDEGEPLKQDKIEGDFVHAAASLQNFLELVEVANSYVQLNKGQLRPVEPQRAVLRRPVVPATFEI